MTASIRIFTIILFIITALTNGVEAKNPKYKKVGSGIFKRQIAKTQMVVIDVRTPEEYETAHLENAKIINFEADDFKEKISKLPKEIPVCIYCCSGNRSAKSMEILKKEGFRRVYHLKGGIKTWQEKGLKTVQ